MIQPRPEIKVIRDYVEFVRLNKQKNGLHTHVAYYINHALYNSLTPLEKQVYNAWSHLYVVYNNLLNKMYLNMPYAIGVPLRKHVRLLEAAERLKLSIAKLNIVRITNKAERKDETKV